MSTDDRGKLDFIRSIVDNDLRSGRHSEIVTRFPPEPNGFLHIGHAKSICLNFGIAAETGGRCHLRFDDTNPIKEEQRYIDSIQEDVRWLGFDWGEHLYFASDYFERLYELAVQLIDTGRAYVCDLTAEQIRAYRGTLKEPGRNSPYRDRTVAENRELFARMRAGEFPDGSHTLRAKIDMASGNLNLRDPVMYRIVHAAHPRTGDAWCIYPTYDWAHGQSDAIEGITHSLCTLEFEDHRPLYEWFVEHLDFPTPPRQIEFARLNLSHTIMSKRKLLKLVTSSVVRGWDDPRMPTLSGLRRRGYTPEAIRSFCDMIGLAKRNSMVDLAQLEFAIRDDLNRKVRRVMGVLNPLKVVITNLPEEGVEDLDAPYFPDDPEQMGWRKVPFSRELYIDRNDFRLEPPKKYFRLAPDREVRLRWGYFIRCTEVVTDPDTGEVTELRCTFDPATRGGNAPDGRKVKGTIHWVSAEHAIDAEVRLYGALLAVPELPEDATDVLDHLNPSSEQILTGCKLEPSLATAEPGDRFQLERTGYFCVDPDSRPGYPVLNRTVTLRDSWAKIEKQMDGGKR